MRSGASSAVERAPRHAEDRAADPLDVRHGRGSSGCGGRSSGIRPLFWVVAGDELLRSRPLLRAPRRPLRRGLKHRRVSPESRQQHAADPTAAQGSEADDGAVVRRQRHPSVCERGQQSFRDPCRHVFGGAAVAAHDAGEGVRRGVAHGPVVVRGHESGVGGRGVGSCGGGGERVCNGGLACRLGGQRRRLRRLASEPLLLAPRPRSSSTAKPSRGPAPPSQLARHQARHQRRQKPVEVRSQLDPGVGRHGTRGAAEAAERSGVLERGAHAVSKQLHQIGGELVEPRVGGEGGEDRGEHGRGGAGSRARGSGSGS